MSYLLIKNLSRRKLIKIIGFSTFGSVSYGLFNLLNEKTYSHDMTTSGGNASLFMLPEKND